MNCIRCKGLMFAGSDYHGSWLECLCCGHVAYDSVLDKDVALAERTGKRGRRSEPMHHGRPV